LNFGFRFFKLIPDQKIEVQPLSQVGPLLVAKVYTGQSNQPDIYQYILKLAWSIY